MLRFVRPFFALLVGLGAGYWLGYRDAYSGGNGTLGARVASVVGKVHPDEISRQRQENAERLREHIRATAQIEP